MQVGAGIWMRLCNRFVKLDTEARGVRDDDVAVFPAHWSLEDLSVESAPGADALQDQEVRDAGGQLHVGGALDRAAVQMWRHLRVVRFRHAGDLLRLQDPTDAAERHMDDRGR